MYRNGLTVILFGLFIFQSTILKWMIPVSWQTNVMVAPQLTLVVVLLIGIYADRHLAMIYGLAFGLLQDLVFYGPMIGTYTFSMGLMGYLVGLTGQRRAGGIVPGLFTLAIGDLMFQWILYGLYRLFQLTHADIHWIVFRQMLPSLLVDLLFALAVYVPLRKLLEQAAQSAEAKENEEG